MARDGETAAATPSRRIRDEGRLLEEVVAILSLTAGVFSLLSFASYHRGAEEMNIGGQVGFGLAHTLVQALGLASYLIPFFLLVVAVLGFRQSSDEISAPRALGAGVLTITVAVLLGLARTEHPVTLAGGWVGGFMATVMAHAFGKLGSYLLTGALFILSFLFVTRTSLGGLAAAAAGATARVFSRLKRVGERSSRQGLLWRSRVNIKREPAPSLDAAPPIIVLSDEPEEKPASSSRRRRQKPVQEEFHFDGSSRYQLPPFGFLDAPSHGAVRVDEEALHKSSQILEAKLADFGIQGKVVEVRPGPVITTFDIEPAAGVKVNRIVSLADDLAMALRVPGVRILAPVPGKAVVGIEVANPKREEVRLRELLEHPSFANSPSPLTLALGKDTAGVPVFGDLARMPHLLIAGATGSGKSVAINAMIMSILYKAPPRDVRFIMIDLKMLELSVYEDIPHLLVPVVTDPKKAVAVLKNITEEMDQRYQMMKDRGARNIDGYNRMIEQELSEREAGVIELNELADENGSESGAEAVAKPFPLERLPKIVVIIDELADLMMTMGRQVEEPITRLAQKARAAGVHLVLATQRPSVDVITGLIKANFPARISFQVTARVDSRTILDHIGAERLLGGGDMLYMPPGTARLQRLQGPLVTEAEIRKVVEFVRAQGTPQYAFGLLESHDEEDEEEIEEDMSDELYDQAVRLVTESGQASISWVQRRLRIGYNRAARMIERMEREGVVTPSESGRPREVIARRIED
jgi:S-DNA-T family DNA segregation ATPase FtsK/SpoIIIE